MKGDKLRRARKRAYTLIFGVRGRGARRTLGPLAEMAMLAAVIGVVLTPLWHPGHKGNLRPGLYPQDSTPRTATEAPISGGRADGLRTTGPAYLISAPTPRTPLIGSVYLCGPIA
jgi:hypothetical protein